MVNKTYILNIYCMLKQYIRANVTFAHVTCYNRIDAFHFMDPLEFLIGITT